MADLPYCGGVAMLWATKVTPPFSEKANGLCSNKKERLFFTGKRSPSVSRNWPSRTTLEERAHWVGQPKHFLPPPRNVYFSHTGVGGKLKPFFTIDLTNFDLGSICLHKPFLKAAPIILPASNQGCAPQRSTTRDGVDSRMHT